eukprot:1159078-Pelagomonas_calceolata.AAC.3
MDVCMGAGEGVRAVRSLSPQNSMTAPDACSAHIQSPASMGKRKEEAAWSVSPECVRLRASVCAPCACNLHHQQLHGSPAGMLLESV